MLENKEVNPYPLGGLSELGALSEKERERQAKEAEGHVKGFANHLSEKAHSVADTLET